MSDFPTSSPASAGGLSDNIAAGLAYLFVIPAAIIFLFLDPYKSRPFVRFSCIQGLLLIPVYIVLGILLVIPVIKILAYILYLVVAICALVALVMAFMGKKFSIPVIGNIAEGLASR